MPPTAASALGSSTSDMEVQTSLSVTPSGEIRVVDAEARQCASPRPPRFLPMLQQPSWWREGRLRRHHWQHLSDLQKVCRHVRVQTDIHGPPQLR